MKISLVVAAARNRAIGFNNKMPWHLPEDLKYFKRVTMGKPVIMGRNTFESIGKPLPGRPNIVISRNGDYKAEGITLAHSLDEALSAARKLLPSGMDEVMVIGGAQIYAQALPQADRLYLTEVDAEPQADAFFPTISRNEWRETSRESHAACERNPYPYSFVVLDKKK
ncbi:MAG TPA: type 3 dihydrofolate reductase [Candidatus Acidoferrum sp.]|nr:type 3 dihydrofolate reductase [Candidatus Acidoferrum sp.]